MRRAIFLLALAVSAAGCAGTATSAAPPRPTVDPYASDSNACRHWRNIMGDVKAGILTDSELRAKVSEVRESATSAPVRSAATQLLAGVTSKKKDQILSGYAALEAACS
jgi:hypothetical protein